MPKAIAIGDWRTCSAVTAHIAGLLSCQMLTAAPSDCCHGLTSRASLFWMRPEHVNSACIPRDVAQLPWLDGCHEGPCMRCKWRLCASLKRCASVSRAMAWHQASTQRSTLHGRLQGTMAGVTGATGALPSNNVCKQQQQQGSSSSSVTDNPCRSLKGNPGARQVSSTLPADAYAAAESLLPQTPFSHPTDATAPF
jgi:hypothetical protein